MTDNLEQGLNGPTTHVEGVLVGYDGSPSAGRAVRWAAAEALRRGRPLFVLHAVDLGAPEVTVGATTHDWTGLATKAGRAVVDEGAHVATEAAPGVRVRGVLGEGQPWRVLVEQSRDAELVVVGNRGRGDLASAWLGSVSLATATHAHCPTVVVGVEAPSRLGPEHPIVVGVDGSAASLEALDVAAGLAESSGAPLRIVSAWDPLIERNWGPVYASAFPGGSYGIDAGLREAAGRAVAHGMTRIRETRPAVSVTTATPEGPVAPALADAAADATLLVVGTRRHSAFTGLVLGSVSHRVVHTARCPVMVVHQSGPEPAIAETAPIHVMI